MLTKRTVLIATAIAITSPTVAMAHPGHGFETGWSEGLMHPLTGLDHLLVIAAVALLSVRVGGRALWAVPAAFIACGIAGGVAAGIATSSAAMPWVEMMIFASVLVCGGLLIRRQSTSTIALCFVPMFGLFHGYAHIHEMSGTAGLGTYTAGLIVTTTALLALTIGVSLAVESLRSKESLVSISRTVGGTLVVAAAAMWLGM